MGKQFVKINNAKLIQRLIELARKDTFFLGWALSAYQEIHSIDNHQLAQWLECNLKALDRLALCRLPDDKSSNFQDDIKKIAQFGRCNADRLVQLFREVVSILSLKGDVIEDTRGLLMAARDRKSDGENDSGDA
jgi:hypothetical protein